MATEPGKNFTRLINDLKKNGPSYSVFYAIFLCESLIKTHFHELNEEMLEQKGLKFQPYENYVFPPSNLRSFHYENATMHFVINFLGLYGINAPLPRCYHEQVALQQSVHGQGDVPLQNFLDIFNNRFYWLYYQAWKKYRTYLQLKDKPGNKAMQRVFAFIGQGPSVKQKLLADISQFKLMQLSGILSARIRSKAGLVIMLKEFFPRFPVKIKEFVPQMVRLAKRPQLGGKSSGPSRDAFKLGQNSIVGQSVLDYMSRVCLEIGPIEFEDYLGFLPNEKYSQLLKKALDIYLNDGIEYDVKFIINPEGARDIPWNDRRVKLGQSLWLGRPKEKFMQVYYTHEKLMRAS